ncbi:MAG: hypothetical protein PHF97_11165 [Bacteroidales bacterium]|nr:hypothetical protein [Bacteroidales bacterium]MDD4604350.1 hypothetical protein [Bacteroidales bacterium]
MEGVVVHMIIGLILFTPIGFLTAMYQDRKAIKEEEKKHTKERLNG